MSMTMGPEVMNSDWQSLSASLLSCDTLIVTSILALLSFALHGLWAMRDVMGSCLAAYFLYHTTVAICCPLVSATARVAFAVLAVALALRAPAVVVEDCRQHVDAMRTRLASIALSSDATWRRFSLCNFCCHGRRSSPEQFSSRRSVGEAVTSSTATAENRKSWPRSPRRLPTLHEDSVYRFDTATADGVAVARLRSQTAADSARQSAAMTSPSEGGPASPSRALQPHVRMMIPRVAEGFVPFSDEQKPSTALLDPSLIEEVDNEEDDDDCESTV